MINGIQIQISGEELKKHISERADFHKQKSEWYQTQVKEFEKAQENLPSELQYQNTSNSPVKPMEDKVKDHQQRSTFFAFMADHLVVSEVYQLSQSDLTTLEIISRYF